jgi:hypothetical protein
MNRVLSRVSWAAVAAVAALCLGAVALQRWLVVAAVCVYGI